MKKQTYLRNIKFLINSNLLSLENLDDLSKKSRKQNSANKIKILNVSEYLKSVKQFVRILQFLRNQKKSLLYLEEDMELIFLIKKRNPKISLKTFSKHLFGVKKKDDSNEISKLYLSTTEFSVNDQYLKFLFFHKLYIISSINPNPEKNYLGTYKFHNDLTKIRKQMFFLLLLRKNI